MNFGHTFGHALDAETGFSERLLHGESVACGMVRNDIIRKIADDLDNFRATFSEAFEAL